MEAAVRVFVIADAPEEVHRLTDIFVHSMDFAIAGWGTVVGAEQLRSADVDVVVIRTDQFRPISLSGDVPILWLRHPSTYSRMSISTHAVLSDTASPMQIRAAALALAAGLHFDSTERNIDHSDEEELTLLEPLTDRELEVLNLVAEGLSNPQIAKRLRVSRNTAKFHVSSIIAKLGASSRTEAVTLGLRRGLIII
jgi:DNA-binding CsgD family transcriptional regulator